eukprot:scaffold222770_cov17-Prasinocladus_malaysianus.AAC.1
MQLDGWMHGDWRNLTSDVLFFRMALHLSNAAAFRMKERAVAEAGLTPKHVACCAQMYSLAISAILAVRTQR